ncbi:ABC transporter permease [Thermaerobacter subterraneus]|uniref:ABC-type dipeptide/oligopeptide/nickel transport system, permease component n=1 Tax=Thermaerobacter subterraneus DSM 13965 TaxID=867903 RepID=K6PZQ4_9FIRM|nr:ABC transporter permease [Thermaerobacter subterraneus]EKP94069.1 ABC-type dipeptide/oligopeptide/nickel transport system, permease component [Thermaerobacter subterraneus DSM 13965]
MHGAWKRRPALRWVEPAAAREPEGVPGRAAPGSPARPGLGPGLDPGAGPGTGRGAGEGAPGLDAGAAAAPLPGTADPWRRALRHPQVAAGLAVVALFVLVAVAAPWLAPYDPDDFTLSARLAPPAFLPGGHPEHLLGTDRVGRDLLTRLLYGARVSLLVGATAVTVAGVVGSVLGAVAGYAGGLVDQVLSRAADLLMAFPYLLFTILMMGILGPGIGNLILALTFKAWVEFYRVARGQVLAEKAKPYVEAARAIGRSHAGILAREILPNILHALLVVATLRAGHMILMEASLSFLGIGVPPDVPAWGSMVAEGRDYLSTAWWVSTLPGLAVLVLVLAINTLGDGLRELLDPRLRV